MYKMLIPPPNVGSKQRSYVRERKRQLVTNVSSNRTHVFSRNKKLKLLKTQIPSFIKEIQARIQSTISKNARIRLELKENFFPFGEKVFLSRNGISYLLKCFSIETEGKRHTANRN